MPRACPEQRRRGGRRPGAGAPFGNLNALKHGRTSPRLRQLASALAAIPQVQSLLLDFRRQEQRKVRRARSVARDLLRDLLLTLPSHPDPEINQIVHALLHPSPSTGATKIAQKQSPSKQHNQTPAPLSL